MVEFGRCGTTYTIDPSVDEAFLRGLDVRASREVLRKVREGRVEWEGEGGRVCAVGWPAGGGGRICWYVRLSVCKSVHGVECPPRPASHTALPRHLSSGDSSRVTENTQSTPPPPPH